MADDLDDLRAQLGALPSEDFPPIAAEERLRQINRSAKERQRELAAEPRQRRQRLQAIADLYVEGATLDGDLLFGGARLTRVCLPVYPFAREHHWLRSGPKAAGPAQLHALIHRNTSVLGELRFSTNLTGAETFLLDHQLRSPGQPPQKVLPGVVYLEMARVALALVQDRDADAASPCVLTHIAWIQPVVVARPCTLHLRIRQRDRDLLDFEFYSLDEAAKREVVHARLTAESAAALVQPPARDLRQLLAQMDRGVLEADLCYRRLQAAGVVHGPSLRGIERLVLGQGQLLADLALPAPAASAPWLRHVGLMDAAIQAAIGLEPQQPDAPVLPFALDRLELLRSIAGQLSAWVRDAADSSARVRKLDIELCDPEGQVCVRLLGLSSRAQEAPPARTGLTALLPVWNAVAAELQTAPSVGPTLLIAPPGPALTALQALFPAVRSLALTGRETSDALVALIESATYERLVWVAPPPSADAIAAQAQGVLQLFAVIKALFGLGYDARELEWTLFTFATQAVFQRDRIDAAHASVHGLVGSLVKEVPHWRIRLLDLEPGDLPQPAMFALPPSQDGYAWRGGQDRGKQFFQQALVPVALPPQAGAPRTRPGGVYVVIGGAGGLGGVWTRHLIETCQAKIVWIGRRPLDEAMRARLAQFPEAARPLYFQADATDREALTLAYLAIKRIHPQIHGVVHSAIVLQDRSLALMTLDRFRASLAVKVAGSVNLAEVFGQEPLDFLLFFSSMQAFSRAPGQSNYAAGCTFADAFAHQLARRSPKLAATVKIVNWGYWGQVGIVGDRAYRERMRKAGEDEILPAEGMDLLDRIMAAPFTQVAPVKTLQPEQIQARYGTRQVQLYDAQLPSIFETVARRFAENRDQLAHAQVDRPELERASRHLPMEALLAQLLRAILKGVDRPAAQSRLPRYFTRWFEESQRVLDAAPAASDASLDQLWQRWDQEKLTWLENANHRAAIALVETCVRALPQILSGSRKATDVLFPNGSMRLVEGIYRGNIVADFFQKALADVLVLAIEARLNQAAAKGEPAPRLRILEIGAGTGGTTATVLPRLKPYAAFIETYCYSDLSRAFLLHAETHYAPDCPFLTTALYDVEKSLAEQPDGPTPDHFDFVIAANVLHATRDIRATLRNAKTTLRKHGLLLLNELSDNTLPTHLTFGLLEGWWLYTDAALRLAGCPGLSPATWREVLEEEGFTKVCLPLAEARELGLQVILAESDGVVFGQPRTETVQAVQEPVAHAPIAVAPSVPKAVAAQLSAQELRQKSAAYLKQLVAGTLKLDPARIDAGKALESYGIDSILVIQLTQDLRKVFRKVSNTLFFEVQTIDALVDHFLETQRDALMALVGYTAEADGAGNAAPAPAPAATRPDQGRGDVAVIGLSGRYPQAQDVHQLWANLAAGRSAISEIPADRWDWQANYDPHKRKPGQLYTRWGGFLDDVACFDPFFFHISPAEAEQMDPQERLFLETCYHAIEDAGYTPQSLGRDRKTGVFVGVMNSSYHGKSGYFSIANRVSYQFDLQGPSLAVDTACSSSLAALHLALESLHSGSCKLALAGGVNLISSAAHFQTLNDLNMLASGPECRSFGVDADGFIAAEGVGAVLLKPLDEAIADRDHIYAVLKGSALNAGGKTNGYTVPNPLAQAEVVRAALRRAGVEPWQISYVEAHGTGTALGDPIEVNGLARAFRTDGPAAHCALGSIKSNIGHCESAAGIAGLTKILLQLQHRQLVPSLHAEVLNPNIDFAETPFQVQRLLAPWPGPESGGRSRIAGVSSFGAGGANAHLIVAEYDRPRALPLPPPQEALIVPLSARDSACLRQRAMRLLDWLDARVEEPVADGFNLRNLAYTLQVGREAMAERLGFLVRSLDELRLQLRGWLASEADAPTGVFRARAQGHEAHEIDVDMLNAWLAQRDHVQLLDHWVRGYELDWQRLYEARPYRISLPTYPFLRERYWHQAPRPVASPAASEPGRCFLAHWRPVTLSAPTRTQHRHALVVAPRNPSPFEADLLAACRAAGTAVTLIRLADETAAVAPSEWRCGIADAHGFETCLARAAAIDALFFLALDDRTMAELSLEELLTHQEEHEIQLLRMFKCLKQGGRSHGSVATYVLTLDVLPAGEHVPRPLGAGLTGLAYALAQGSFSFKVHNLDLAEAELESADQRGALIERILAMPASDQGEVFKLRGDQVLAQRFEPVHWPAATPAPIRQGAVILILGGSGSVGQAITRQLQRHFQAQVVWVGRSARTDAKVQTALARCPQPPDYVQADATDLTSLRAAVAAIKQRHGAIHGALFAGMVFNAQNSLEQTTEAEFRRILDVKTKGCLCFYAALEAEPLDFMCFFSSGQAYAFSGAARHAAYAAGITSADAFVRAARSWAPFPVGTINWGFWGTSVATRSEEVACLSDEEGFTCLLDYLGQLRQGDLGQALCLKTTPTILARMNPAPTAAPGASQAAPRQLPSLPSYVRETVLACFAESLKAPATKLDPRVPFSEYGMDSILGVTFIDLLNERLGLSLNTAVIFEYATLARLTEHLCTHHGAELDARAQSAATPAVAPPRPQGQGLAEIAVIGIAGQFPGARDPQAFWENLSQSIDGIQVYPPNYLDLEGFFSEKKQNGKSYCKWGGILEDRDCFDAAFFGIPPREAHAMNRHQRLVLEEGWKAIEDAGYNPHSLAGTATGIYIGAEPSGSFSASLTGSSEALIASRLAYHLDLKGPALVVNTGCSSSGVALHLACESLRSGETDLALVGGVNACMNQEALIQLSAAEMLSAQGRVAAFDRDCDGTLISEGIGMVLLKRLDDAIAAGDAIYGVICASGTNQDGTSNGITAPNGLAQEDLIAAVYRKFAIDPAQIGYVEAHGTGTKLGDPVEVNALVRAFRRFTTARGYCALGTAKAHIGHTSAAAAVIGLIKVLLSMAQGQLLKLPHFKHLNPGIVLDDAPFKIQTENQPWPRIAGKPYLAALNSFGHSGTNVHLVIREAQAPRDLADAPLAVPVLLPFSARTEAQLATLLQSFVAYLARRPQVRLGDLAFTLQQGREPLRIRAVVRAGSIAQLLAGLETLQRGERGDGIWRGTALASDGDGEPLRFGAAALDELAQAWVEGRALAWATFPQMARPRRLHLPTYPFARERYGAGMAAPEPKANLLAQIEAQQEALQNAPMQALLHELLWSSLHQIGLLRSESTGDLALLSLAELAVRHGGDVPAFYQRWLDHSQVVLEEQGYLCHRADGLYGQRPVTPLDQLWARWDQEKQAWLRNPNLVAPVNLVEACMRELPQVLAGRKLITDVMFPKGSLRLVEGIYKQNLVSDYFNQILANSLIEAIQARLEAEPSAKVRILEVGAGTGGTTAGLLPRLRALGDAVAEYCYTDLSEAFLKHARQHYAPGHPWLCTRIFNLEKAPGAQGVPERAYDFVIATNCLHATRNMTQTLSHVQAAMAPDGLLLINEMSDRNLFVHLTFGLLEGWWLYDDAERRIPGIPGLAPAAWSQLLGERGFSAVRFPAESAHRFGQQIIAARGGLVLASQPQPALAPQLNAPPAQLAGPAEEPVLEAFLTELLCGEVAEALQVTAADIALDESFADYGLDSLLGIQFMRALNERLDLDLETVLIFDENSVLRMSRHLLAEHGAAVARAYAAQCPAPPVTAEAARATASSAPPEPARQAPSSPVFEPIALIGMSGRFAQSPDLARYWENLAQGRDLVVKVTRWPLAKAAAEDQSCEHGGFLDEIDRFDPLFFKISGAEATYMDPQQRLFLEEAWRALEDAGYALETTEDLRCGIYLGYGGSDYAQLFDKTQAPAQAFWGNSASIIPARIAYYLNLKGPAVTVDTACSGSLVAMHLGCQSLWTGETDLVLAGGVSVQCTPGFYQTGSQAGMLSPTGKCHSFDEKADGFVPGEGVGVVVLKRLSAATADGDVVHGVIRGSGINQDGRTNGITAPSAQAQERLIREVHERFAIAPESIQWVEAHGTGTRLGDPIEFTALTRSFRAGTVRPGTCALGSVKTNIGHVGPAAGVAGVLKILLALRHRQIPPSLHFEKSNPDIRFEDSPFFVNTRLREWPAGEGAPRRACISSFGFSGTNAHLVLEEAPARVVAQAPRPGYLIALSARTPDQLRARFEQLRAFCDQTGAALELGHLSYTLLCKRKHWGFRLAMVVASLAELRALVAQDMDQLSGPCFRGEAAEGALRLKPALTLFGNQCIATLATLTASETYLENLGAIADLYVQGYGLAFRDLYGPGCQTLSLPTYPFARDRYWVAPQAAPPPAPIQAAAPAPRPQDWLFVREHWVAQPFPQDLDWRERARWQEGKPILVVYCDAAARGQFTELFAQMHAIAGWSEPPLLQLLHVSELAPERLQRMPAVVLFLGAQQRREGDEPAPSLEVRALYQLSRLLMRHAWEQPVRIYALYHSDPAEPRLDCEALTGLIATAMMEHPRHVWTLIGHHGTTAKTTGAQLLLQEWLADGQNPPPQAPSRPAQIFHSRVFTYVRHDNMGRRVQQREAFRFEETATPVFQSGRTLILAGGLGLVGRELCEALARRYRPRLILLSRGACDAARTAQLERLRALGAEVHYYPVDLADRAAMTATFAQIRQAHGPIHGVLHLANQVEGGLIATQGFEQFQAMGRAKVQGSLLLDELTANEPLDFFILFSSIVAFGIRGSAGYSYACAFQNRFAALRNQRLAQGQRTGHTVSLCWGPWTSDPVHANKDPQRAAKIADDGFDLIDIETVWPILERATGQDQSMIGVWAVRQPRRVAELMDVALDPSLVPETPATATPAAGFAAQLQRWEARHPQAVTAEELAAVISFEQIRGLPPEQIHRIHRLLCPGSAANAPVAAAAPLEPARPLAAPQPTPATLGQERTELFKALIREVACELLSLKEMQEDESFQNYGLDSVFGVQLAIRLEKKLNLEIQPQWLIDYPNLRELAAHVSSLEVPN